jgi:hypothetical protein
MNTIVDVIKEMDRIVEICRNERLRAGYFAVLYRMVTIRVKQELADGAFEDKRRMEQLDLIFAKRFFDAFYAWKAGEPVTESWKIAFDSGTEYKPVVLQHMLLGINAHINLDLGIAASETMEGDDLNKIRNDYVKINAILQSMVDRVRRNIGTVSPLFRLLIRLARGRDEMFLNFSIVAARDGAWKFAKRYHVSDKKQAELEARDRIIASLAERIVKPGRWTSSVLRLIRAGEFYPVDQVIYRLDMETLVRD